jgi:2-iminobutanoate/2-iminopropanoate deaminase
MFRSVVLAAAAPPPVGPYSHAISAAGRFMFTSGQLPLDPATGKLVAGDVKAHVRRSLENIRIVLQAAGAELKDVVKVNVCLANIADAKAMNEVYAEFFGVEPPARTTLGGSLPAGALVEIDAIAVLPR